MKFYKKWHFLIGTLLGLITYYFTSSMEIDILICRTIGFAVFIVYLWLTEPISMQVSALLPIILIPALNLLPLKEATSSYAHPVIFLFLGGFIMAKGLEKWLIHKRIALWILSRFGDNPNKIIAAMMITTTLISMIISNTATTIMVLPIAISIIAIIRQEGIEHKSFPIAMLIAIAYAANVGGEGTIIGSPPNVILVGILKEQLNITINFLDWMLVGIPLVIILLIPAYLIITKVFYKLPSIKTEAIKSHFIEEYKIMGPLSLAEKRTVLILALTILLWIFKNNINNLISYGLFTDTGIAILCGFLMINIPSGMKKGEALLSWEEAQKIPWGILIFFGAALSLAKVLSQTGTINYVSTNLLSFPEGFTSFWIIGICIATMLFLTELMGGTALSSIFVPILIGLAASFGVPVLELCFTVVFASNCSFMLPMATPPNTIVFSTGHLKVNHMAIPGLIMNIIGIAVIWSLGPYLINLVFG